VTDAIIVGPKVRDHDEVEIAQRAAPKVRDHDVVEIAPRALLRSWSGFAMSISSISCAGIHQRHDQRPVDDHQLPQLEGISTGTTRRKTSAWGWRGQAHRSTIALSCSTGIHQYYRPPPEDVGERMRRKS